MWAWAYQLNRPHKRPRGLRKPWHVSFAKGVDLMGKGVAHAVDYDFSELAHMLWRSGHQCCSCNVLVGTRLAQGCHDDYLRRAGQAAPRCPPGRGDCPGCKSGTCSRRELQLMITLRLWWSTKPAWCTTGSRRRVRLETWRLESYNRGSCLLRRQCKLRNYMVTCTRNNKLSYLVQAHLALARVGRPCTNHRQTWRRMRNGGWQRRCDSVRPVAS